MLRAATARETSEVLCTLMTLSHPSFVMPIRVNNSGADITSNGLLYQAFPFEPVFPRDTEDGPPLVTLTICNVSREIVTALRPISGERVQVKFEVILAATPDVVEYGPLNFELKDVRYDAFVVEGTLGYEDMLNEPFPKDTMTPPRFPALFKI
jgi:hypothetical protein